MSWRHPTGRSPKRVTVVALGQSCQAYMRHQLTKGLPAGSMPDEVWTVNRGIRLFAADLAFVLDELPSEMTADPAYGEALRRYEKPIISTVCSTEVQHSVRYPAPYILDCLRERTGHDVTDPYWHNSMPMVVAYAWFIGVEELTLWGCDYNMTDGRVIEADRANLEYWVGWVRSCGMRVGVPTETTLLNQARTGGALHVYGLRDQGQAASFLGLDEAYQRNDGEGQCLTSMMRDALK